MSGVAEMSPKYLMEGALNAIPVGYKQSDVGIIPEDWETKPLGELVEIYSGDSPSKFVFSTEGTPYFKVEQLNNGSVYADSTPYFIHSSKKVLAGSVIFPKRGASILSNKIRVLKHDSFMDTNLMALTCHHGLDELFLYNQLTYRGLDSVADTTSIPQINNKHISPYLVPLPRKAEQTAIANALSDVDALISELEKLIAKKQAIKTATMQQLLTGRTRLPQFALREDGTPKGTKPSELGEIPVDWEVVTLGTASSFINGRAYSLHEWENSGTPVIRLQNLTGRGDEYYYSNLQLPEKQYCKYGDLLFMWSATFGPVIWRGPKAIYHYHIWKIACEVGYSQSYLFYLLDDMTEKLKRSSSSGGTMLHVTKEKMESTKAAFPSYEEQTAIATILSDMDAEIQALEQRLGKTRQIKQGMMQELLTGKTRLPYDKE
ncbi:restriction endonuclease subunit S [Providencia manganoxydans]|uniref:restriction endonuclease subunit S n=2 Tax=Providencia manganoxydans TaxID=2923283 RepID=UPI0029BFADA4|nr:restriction endonuclease subunit S [Providencia manganoxydans]MDX4947835.1 restriction endonuclease subunit S [Providencia manganoxydans]